MSDTNRVRLSYIPEATYNTTDSAAHQIVRYTGESINQVTGTVTSAEIRDDRNVTDIIRNGLSVAGDVNVEFSYGTFDDWFEAAFLSAAWTSQSTIISATANTELQITTAGVLTDNGASNALANVEVGDVITLSNFTGVNNDSWLVTVTTDDNTVTVVGDATPTNETVTASASANGVVTLEPQIKNGTTFRSFTLQKQFTDLTNQYHIATGCAIDTLNLTYGSDTILTGSFGFIGSSMTTASASAGSGSSTAATTTSVLNAIDNVKLFAENATSYDITNFSLAMTNNLRPRLQVGTLGAISIGTGFVGATGTVQAYFEDAEDPVLDRYLNFTTSSLYQKLEDAAGNQYFMALPSVKFTSGQVVAGAQNQDAILDLGYSAFYNADAAAAVVLSRVPAA